MKTKTPWVERKTTKGTRGHASPLVESVASVKGEWHVEDVGPDAPGQTSITSREMFVPTTLAYCRCGKDHSSAVRTHELLHSRFSPPKEDIKVEYKDRKGLTKEVPFETIEVAEENRMGYIMHANFPNDSDNYVCRRWIESGVNASLDKDDYIGLIKFFVAGTPSTMEKDFHYIKKYTKSLRAALKNKVFSDKDSTHIKGKLEALKQLVLLLRKIEAAASQIMSTYDNAIDRHSSLVPTWRNTERLAIWLHEFLPKAEQELKAIQSGEHEEDADLKALTAMVEAGKNIRPSAFTHKPDKKSIPEIRTYDDDFTYNPKWGKPEIITAKLPERLAPWKIGKSRRAVDEGTVPRYMHRWPTDQRVFDRKKKIPGGTLLIDDSGSMGFSAQQILDIMEAAPASTIAIYAGQDGGASGQIKIIAKDGKMASKDDLQVHGFAGNGIDGPALDWLANQAYPRIWVSDGGVTDEVGTPMDVLAKECAEKCKKNRITMARNIREAHELFTGKKPLAR